MSNKKEQKFLIQGAVGQLEVLLEFPAVSTDPKGMGIVCHPHPLFQGTMHNKVAHTLAKSFIQKGFLAIRFNFRGVGESEGVHADGIGEVEDLRAVFRWAKGQWPKLKTYLAGFSFGSFVALQFIQNHQSNLKNNLQQVIVVAPPIGRWDFSSIEMPDIPVLVLQGLQDDLVEATAVESWVATLSPSPKFTMFDSTGHFFHGHLTLLREQLVSWLNE